MRWELSLQKWKTSIDDIYSLLYILPCVYFRCPREWRQQRRTKKNDKKYKLILIYWKRIVWNNNSTHKNLFLQFLFPLSIFKVITNHQRVKKIEKYNQQNERLQIFKMLKCWKILFTPKKYYKKMIKKISP